MKTNLFGLFQEEIAEQIREHKLEKYRAKQIAEWMYRHHASSFSEMTTLSKKMQAVLEDHVVIERVTCARQKVSADNKTIKFLFSFADGETAETVLMRQPYGNSVCLSTQVGCAMGCLFCASTLAGLKRNLTAGEILSQLLFVQKMLGEEGQHVTSIVLMGSGEPLVNYDNVVRFLRLCHEPYTMGLSYRSMTLSTCGIVPSIYRLAEEGLPITLSISLHAPNDEIRSEIMPINRKYGIDEVLRASEAYYEKTGRRITYEYTLIDGKNDMTSCADELVRRLRGQNANVNLIPVNPVPERGLNRPSLAKINQFCSYLQNHKIQTTIRKEMGTDINAACGQLRNQYLKQKK